MSENKKRIVLASVLKPVSDPRMTEKIAATLSRDDRYDVHVIGYPASYSSKEKITFHSFATFGRISWKRFTAAFNILQIIRKLNPSVLIIGTHELLGVALLAKLFRKTKVVYDVQENYYLNILHTNAFNPIVKFPIAAYVRLKEKMASVWVDHYFLAEEIYSKQLDFARNKSTVLPNKVIPITLPAARNVNPLALVFTGTLARSTGVFDAIQLAKKLHECDNRTTLKIIGFAAMEAELKEMECQIRDSSFIELVGGKRRVNHEEIVQAIFDASWAVISYELNPATEGRIPTKLYEYLAYSIPVIFTQHYPAWKELAKRANHAFVVLDPFKPDLSKMTASTPSVPFRGTMALSLTWKNEENKLQTAISAL